MDKIINRNIKFLSLGLMQGDHEKIYSAHRKLYEVGSKILPDLEQLLIDKKWTEIQYGKQLLFLTGILNLIHDIDEEYSKNVGKTINERGASSTVKSSISMVTNFTIDNFCKFKKSNIEIFLSNEIKNHSYVIKKIEKWLSILSEDDFDNLSKIYIVPGNYGYADYTPILCKIVIGWDTSISYYNPFTWLFMLNVESSFYREIGHHKFKHSLEKDLDEKKQAKQYAYQRLSQNHPFLMKFVANLLSLFGK